MKKLTRLPLVIGVAVVIVGPIIAGYLLRWDWTGFPAKTLWDWLSVLAIPAAVGFGTIWITTKQAQEGEIENTDNQREAALQAYIDSMSELLLVNNLRQSAEGDEVRTMARVRTLTVLRRLDPIRKASVLQFLKEAGLINTKKCIVDLNHADLRGTVLSNAELENTTLSGVNLTGANLFYAHLDCADLNCAILSAASLNLVHLEGADLSCAMLGGVNLRNAHLKGVNLNTASLFGADLAYADLSGANLSNALGITDMQLSKAKSLKEATMPDGSKHP